MMIFAALLQDTSSTSQQQTHVPHIRKHSGEQGEWQPRRIFAMGYAANSGGAAISKSGRIRPLEPA
jgi:hypothetical protein